MMQTLSLFVVRDVLPSVSNLTSTWSMYIAQEVYYVQMAYKQGLPYRIWVSWFYSRTLFWHQGKMTQRMSSLLTTYCYVLYHRVLQLWRCKVKPKNKLTILNFLTSLVSGMVVWMKEIKQNIRRSIPELNNSENKISTRVEPKTSWKDYQ